MKLSSALSRPQPVPCQCLWYGGGTPCTVTTLLSCWVMITQHDQNPPRSLVRDPGLKVTVPSAEMQEAPFSRLTRGIRRDRARVKLIYFTGAYPGILMRFYHEPAGSVATLNFVGHRGIVTSPPGFLPPPPYLKAFSLWEWGDGRWGGGGVEQETLRHCLCQHLNADC